MLPWGLLTLVCVTLLCCPYYGPLWTEDKIKRRSRPYRRSLDGKYPLSIFITRTFLLFRTGSVQCMLVKMGIISCSRLSGLIRVLFIRVNWYLKSFPPAMTRIFHPQLSWAAEGSAACVLHGKKRRISLMKMSQQTRRVKHVKNMNRFSVCYTEIASMHAIKWDLRITWSRPSSGQSLIFSSLSTRRTLEHTLTLTAVTSLSIVQSTFTWCKHCEWVRQQKSQLS